MATRALTGRVTLADGTAPPDGSVVRARALGVLPSDDADGLLMSRSRDWPVTAGVVAGDVVAGALYEWGVYDPDGRELMPPFVAPVAPGGAPVDFAALYASVTTYVPPGPTLAEVLADYELRARRGAADGYAPLGSDGRVPSGYLPPAGLGDMMRAVYDTNADGKVDAAAAADAAPWAGVTGKPDSFPPATHDHDGAYYTKAQVDGIVAALTDRVGLTPYCIVEGQKPLGQHGGEHPQGQDVLRELGVVIYNGSGEADGTLLSGNAVLLKAGRVYTIDAWALGCQLDSFAMRLRSAAGALLIEGPQEYISNSVGLNHRGRIYGVVVVPAGADLAVKLYSESSAGNAVGVIGQGLQGGSAVGLSVEKYAGMVVHSMPIQ